MLAAHAKVFMRYNQKNPTMKIDIPFMKDYSGKSPLHRALDVDDPMYNSANFFLKILQDMKLDHHGRAIYDILPQVIASELSQTAPYLVARTNVETSDLANINTLPKRKLRVSEDQRVSLFSMWEWLDNIVDNKEYFTVDEKSEDQVDLRLIDIPFINRMGGNCFADQFF